MFYMYGSTLHPSTSSFSGRSKHLHRKMHTGAFSLCENEDITETAQRQCSFHLKRKVCKNPSLTGYLSMYFVDILNCCPCCILHNELSAKFLECCCVHGCVSCTDCMQAFMALLGYQENTSDSEAQSVQEAEAVAYDYTYHCCTKAQDAAEKRG